jgi:hypothetical protein
MDRALKPTEPELVFGRTDNLHQQLMESLSTDDSIAMRNQLKEMDTFTFDMLFPGDKERQELGAKILESGDPESIRLASEHEDVFSQQQLNDTLFAAVKADDPQLTAALIQSGANAEAFGDQLEPEYESEGLLVLCLNTSRPKRHKDGAVSSAQIARVARRLRAARPEQLRVVMQHHPVRAQEAADLTNLLIGHEEAVPTWVDAGLDLLIGGHIHLPYVRPLLGADGESGRRAWTAQAGTALSTRVRGGVPNSVNLIVHAQDQGQHHCCVERWDYSAREDGFVNACSHTLAIHRTD